MAGGLQKKKREPAVGGKLPGKKKKRMSKAPTKKY